MPALWAGGEIMPTRIIQYECCKCLQIYPNEQTAIDCENRHLKLNDFEILNISNRIGTQSRLFPDCIHVINKKTNKVAFYDFCHDKVTKSVKQEWLDRLDKTYKNSYRFDSGIFPIEEEDG